MASIRTFFQVWMGFSSSWLTCQGELAGSFHVFNLVRWVLGPASFKSVCYPPIRRRSVDHWHENVRIGTEDWWVRSSLERNPAAIHHNASGRWFTLYRQARGARQQQHYVIPTSSHPTGTLLFMECRVDGTDDDHVFCIALVHGIYTTRCIRLFFFCCSTSNIYLLSLLISTPAVSVWNSVAAVLSSTPPQPTSSHLPPCIR